MAREGDLKTENADRFIPIDLALLEMLTEAMEYGEGEPEDYIFHNEDGMALGTEYLQAELAAAHA